MKIRLLASLFFAPLLHAAVTISQPVTLRDGMLGTRGAFNAHALIAQSGGTFAVAWTETGDDRLDHLFIAPLASLYSALDTTRMVDAGSIASGSTPYITSGGSYYAVSYTATDLTRRVRLYDRDLAPVTASIIVPNTVDTMQMIWSGHDFILPGTPPLNFFNATGFRSAATILDTSQFQIATVKAGAALPDGSSALVLTWPVYGCFDICGAAAVPLTAIALDDAHQTQRTTLLSSAIYPPSAAIGSSSSGFLVVWPNVMTQTATIFDANGAVKATIPLEAFLDLQHVSARALIAGDGDEWLIDTNGKLYQIEGTAIASTTTAPKAAQLIRTGPGSYVAIYVESDDAIHARIQLLRITTQAQRTRGSRH